MKRLFELLAIILLTLLVFDIVAGWLWYIIGYDRHVAVALSLPEFVIRNITFPILFTVIAVRLKPLKSEKYWYFWAFLICLIPLLISTSVGGFLKFVASSMTPEKWIGVGIEVMLSYLVTIGMLFFAFKWKRLLPKGFWYGVTGFLLGNVLVGNLIGLMMALGMKSLWLDFLAIELVVGLIIYLVRKRNTNLVNFLTLFATGPLLFMFGYSLWLLENAIYHHI
ncbi:hypothetical protein [Alicyclobacillus sp. SO9]|uniref:hypothetical protein n=1 Tax=Alicyclobacillus sp. SO9 TaxID=2665646 RepID=UPI0018E861C2|nr:hypothetical protein [Alicyclobacillus sp. SO9]QQE79709.1 hypothetical protein GI364_04255 [Alicyclobacillus sp. SO9]